ncbi:MAG TPA: hypothetical protein VHW00_20860 [Thermoanaerobaculia bacterium]|nr:hypothetical protein [Thermoanaerobaculia bacterium]
MILYRKASPLRIRRTPVPEPPFWAATTIAPYSAKRTTPIAIDYQTLRASGAERLEVQVADHVRDELERAKTLHAPLLIDAAEACEIVFRRGEEALQWCDDEGRAALLLASNPPSRKYDQATIVIPAWPLRQQFAANENRWGVAVPIVYPCTTDLDALETLADGARDAGASFFAPIAIDVEPTARQAIVTALQLRGDDDRYAMLFHAPLEPLHLATERHVAALAAERDMADFIVPPNWNERSNWNAAVLLTLTASRMIAMELDLDLAGSIARSARLIAELDKPIARIAESARISIIGGLDETSAEMLEEWMRGEEPSFAAFVNEQWRLRRM